MTAFVTPPVATAGQVLLADDWNDVRGDMLHLTEVQDWAPTVSQPGTITRTVTYGKYWVAGKRVWAECFLTISGTGTAGSAMKVSLPINASSASGLCIGSATFVDASDSFRFRAGVVIADTASTAAIALDNQTNYLGALPSLALAASDQLRFSIFYESV